MHRVPLALGGVALALIGFAAGRLSVPTRSHPRTAEIERAQAASFYGKKPSWLGQTDSDELFKGVRNRGYAFCGNNGQIDAKCAFAQDEAVGFSIAALVLAKAQREMKDKGKLGQKELWVATNPEIAQQVLDECWQFYRKHGGMDARLLSICLGNLTDASPLVPLPVP